MPLKTEIRHKTQNVIAKHLQCQCIVSGRSCRPSPYIFDRYLFYSGPRFENTGLENLENCFTCVKVLLLSACQSDCSTSSGAPCRHQSPVQWTLSVVISHY